VSTGERLHALFEALRPYQWVKNVLVFVPLAAAHRLGQVAQLRDALQMFAAFCLCASSIYLLNDLHDAADDARHPHKLARPIPSGRLPRRLAATLMPALLLIAMLTAAPLGLAPLAVLAAYAALMTAYTVRLRSIVLLDAFVLASGYALRVVTGGAAVGIRPSARLLAFCIFIFFSLALLKRYAELALLAHDGGSQSHARAYTAQDAEVVLVLGAACGVLSVLVLAMYMSSDTVARLYSRSGLIWGTAVLMLYWVSYLWLTAHRGRMTDDPLVFALKDRTSLVLIGLMGACAWLAI